MQAAFQEISHSIVNNVGAMPVVTSQVEMIFPFSGSVATLREAESRWRGPFVFRVLDCCHKGPILRGHPCFSSLPS
jgi:hypothetical protein